MKKFPVILILGIAVIASFSITTVASSADMPGIGPAFLPLPQHSVAMTDGPLSTLSNPAGLGIRDESTLMLLAPYMEKGDFGDWGLALKAGNLGFMAETHANILDENDYDRRRYTIGYGEGNKSFYMGFAYSWTTRIDRQNSWDIGALARPVRCVSIGAVARGVNQPVILGTKSYVGFDLGLAVRPLAPFGDIGNNYGHKLTLFADINMRRFDEVGETGTAGFLEAEDYADNIAYKFGAALELVPGITAHLDYQPEVESSFLPQDEQILGGLTFSFGNSSVGAYQKSGDGTGVAYIEAGELYKKTILQKKSKRFVEINLAGTVKEYNRSRGIFSKRSRTIYGFHKEIERYAEDPTVEGLVLKIGGIGAGWAKMQEMRNALIKFKATGKTIVVFMETAGNGSYFLASVADKIYMPPAGDLNMSGMAAHMMFLRGTFDKIGVDPQMEHIGDYKSYSDMFTRDNMSDAQAEATNAILDDLYGELVKSIAEGRGKTEDEVRELFDQGPFSAQEALESGLIDSLVYEDQVEDLTKELVDGKASLVSDKSYNSKEEYDPEWNDLRKKSIALIYGTGGITSGNSSDGGLFSSETMGSKTIAKAIRSARKNKDIKAIVFRVDSPGGSALASELILREVNLCTEGDEKKPFIVSMSDVAGSGGYYVACQADTIIALPNTITGSIGVVSGKLTYDGLQKKIGVNTATLRRGEHADMYAGYRSFTDEEWSKLRDHINQFYQIFIQRVADGRDMDTSEVNKVAQGRIWSGTRAKELGLVDETGGLDMALEIAAKASGVKDKEDYDVVMYPKSSKGFDLGSGMQMMVKNTLPDVVVEMIDLISEETRWKEGEILYLIPYNVDIK